MQLRFQEVEFDSAPQRATIELRRTILREPLGLVFSPDELAREQDCHHLAAFLGDQVVACLVLEPLGSERVQMRQVAIRTDLQRQGIGTGLVAFCEDFCRRTGYAEIIAHARELAVPFYERLGYERIGERFVEVGIAHFLVQKRL